MNFLELAQPAAYVAHVDLAEFASLAQVLDNRQDLRVRVL